MKAIIQHLRFPFSFLLMPVFFYAACFTPLMDTPMQGLWLVFIILHVLVYPSSNAYNSTQDKDEGSVGLIKDPLPVPAALPAVCLVMDIAAIALSLLVSAPTALLVFFYILASRLYSWRMVRLKQYPFLGFFTVFLCQGALVYFIVLSAGNPLALQQDPFFYGLGALPASLLIGSMYPLSQIYQHQQDKKDGVITISAWLGYRGTFIFSGLQFAIAAVCILYALLQLDTPFPTLIFIACSLPVAMYFTYWFIQVTKDSAQADYRHTMRMNTISAICMNVCFGTLCFIRYIW